MYHIHVLYTLVVKFVNVHKSIQKTVSQKSHVHASI